MRAFERVKISGFGVRVFTAILIRDGLGPVFEVKNKIWALRLPPDSPARYSFEPLMSAWLGAMT